MAGGEDDEIREFWDRTAADWHIQVGSTGDENRMLNSDPVLWTFAGDVRGLRVLDAGCGTGYLSRQLADRGAVVTGVDVSERMIEIARAERPGIDFRVDSCSELRTVGDGDVDLVVANYVLMDVPDLEGTVRAFHRVLRAGGAAVLVFSHPCFPQGRAVTFPYFERRKVVDPPWSHFTQDFIWFHRPLSDYWKAFRAAAFVVDDFDEPRSTSETAAYSVAVRLRRA